MLLSFKFVKKSRIKILRVFFGSTILVKVLILQQANDIFRTFPFTETKGYFPTDYKFVLEIQYPENKVNFSLILI